MVGAEALLEVAAGLGAIPPFSLPPPVVELHPEWNEPISADITVTDRMIEMSGKKREDLTPADLDILARAEAGNNSYLRDRERPLQFVTGVGEPTR
jgi:hypothetical protein